MERYDDGELFALEKDWIAAEAEADQAKALARRAERAAAELSTLGSQERDEVKLLIGQARTYAQRRDEAEAQAAAAFDRYWHAQSVGKAAGRVAERA